MGEFLGFGRIVDPLHQGSLGLERHRRCQAMQEVNGRPPPLTTFATDIIVTAAQLRGAGS